MYILLCDVSVASRMLISFIPQPDKDREAVLRERENVRVVVRVRPLSEKESQAGFQSIVESDDLNCSVLVTNPAAQDGEPPKVFTFDSVFGQNSKQVGNIFVIFFIQICVFPFVIRSLAL